ncbi:MAG: endonuclease/exonuclease/phosphatase family protein [Dehalococcoidia bacterium]|nr:endonuclease/exonuclease/phosphatase family protein [Dehalococcoidia bacterium]
MPLPSAGYVFAEFPWQAQLPDPRSHRLCAAGGGRPASAAGGDCALEGASFIRAEAPPGDEIVVLAYNVERGFRAAAQVEALRRDAALPAADILLLSEVDRGCSRTGYRNVAADYARALGMCYVFGVEFVELPRRCGAGGRIAAPCEHGNVILSRYPLGNVRLIRHAASVSWRRRMVPLLRLGEPRLGGRVALAADVKIGERYLHVYSVHFESGRRHGGYRLAQAVELAADAAARPFGAVIGGDMNTGGYLADLRDGAGHKAATRALLERGFVDAHSRLAPADRATTQSGVAIDLIFGNGDFFTDAGIGSPAVWGGLSDHLPVWAKVRLG